MANTTMVWIRSRIRFPCVKVVLRYVRETPAAQGEPLEDFIEPTADFAHRLEAGARLVHARALKILTAEDEVPIIYVMMNEN